MFSHGVNRMGNKDFLPLEQKKMDAAAYVARAREMAAALEDRESLNTRSRPTARQRVARIAGVPASLLHSLRYRPPKTIAADVYNSLCAAIERKALEQIRMSEHEIAAVRARYLGVDNRAFGEAGVACREAEAAIAKARALLNGAASDT
jgi:hypothetical protein